METETPTPAAAEEEITKTYRVRYTRTVLQEQFVEIEAANEEDALDQSEDNFSDDESDWSDVEVMDGPEADAATELVNVDESDAEPREDEDEDEDEDEEA